MSGSSPLAIALLISVLGAGKSDVEKAKWFFKEGSKAYRAEQYSVAVSMFEEAYALAPRAEVVFSLAQAHRLQYVKEGRVSGLQRAISLYREYLEKFPDGSRLRHAQRHLAVLEPILAQLSDKDLASEAGKDEERTQLVVSVDVEGARAWLDGEEIFDLDQLMEVEPGPHEIRIEAQGYRPRSIQRTAIKGRLVAVDAELEPLPARLRVSAPDDSEIALDGRVVGRAPLSRPLEVASGSHFVAVTNRGHYAYTRELSLSRGEEATVVANMESTTQRTVSYAFLGTGAALFAVATLSAIAASSLSGQALDIESRMEGPNARPLTVEEVARHQRLVSQRDQARMATIGVGLTSFIVGGVGILLYLMDNPRAPGPSPSAASGVSLGAQLAPGVVAGSLTASF